MPSPEQIETALALIKKSGATYLYFFEKLQSPAWLAPLSEHGLFKNPPGREHLDDDTFLFPRWAASGYLSRMASLPEAQEDVLRISLDMAVTDNVNVHYDLFEVAMALPPSGAAKLVPRARSWVQSPYNGLVKYKIGDLIARLANGGQTREALQLAEYTFALRPDTRDPDCESSLPDEPKAWLDDWHYEEALKESVPALTAADALKTTKRLCALLARSVELSTRSDRTDHADYSYIWHSGIEHDESHPQLKNSLVSAVRNAAVAAIEARPALRQDVLKILRSHAWTVFRRIELDLLRRFSELMADEIDEIALELVQLEGSMQHEAALLLGAAFGGLSREKKEEILEDIEDGPEEGSAEAWFRFLKTGPTAENIAAFNARWRAKRYLLISNEVPGAWQSRIQEVIKTAGEVCRPDQLEPRTGWVGRPKPEGAENLEQMRPEEAVVFLRNWRGTSGPLEATHEDVGRILSSLIASDPSGYVAQSEEFRALDPTFVRFFFSGLEEAVRARKSFDWSAALSLAKWVIAQPRQILGRNGQSMDADPDWEWTLRSIASLLEKGLQDGRVGELDYLHRDLVVSVLEPLTDDVDPTNPREADYFRDSSDPTSLAINSVRGKAFNALVAYALWVRRNLDRLDKPPDATFDAMPEVRRILNSHLETTREPSLAIRSVYGQFFPWLIHLDREWARGAVERIFPKDASLSSYRSAAWNAYILFCRPYRNVLPVLRTQYAQSIAHLAQPYDGGVRHQDPREHLASHVAVYYWWGDLAIDDPLLVDFFRIAPVGIRGQMIETVRRSLLDYEGPIDEPIEKRLSILWEWRLHAAAESGKAAEFSDELAEFGWWFASKKLDDA